MNNNTELQNIDIKKNVLEKINSDQVKMIPRFYFILKMAGLFFVLILTIFISSLLISYILFALKVSGQLFLLGFGLKGLEAFVILLPWPVLLLDCILLVILNWILKRFSFAYHSPFLYLFIGSMSLVLVAGYIISFTSIHGNLSQMTRDRHLYVFNGFYEGLKDHHKEDGIFRGIVVSINGNTFIVRHDDFDGDNDDVDEKVIVQDVSDASMLVYVGEDVFVAGDRVNGEIHAYGVREVLPTD